MIQEIRQDMETKMKSTIEALRREYAVVRTGRASVSLLDTIKVDYYGSLLPLSQVATLSTPEPRLIVIQPWDNSIIGKLEKAILKSDLGLTPSNDGKVIRLPIPQLTEERRKQLVKLIHRKAEECRISIRNSRREAIEMIRHEENDKSISEDESYKNQQDIQKLTDSYIEKIHHLQQGKEKELLEV